MNQLGNQLINQVGNQLIQGSCENLGEVPDGSVALTVTSPPYWNAIDYDIHSQDTKAWYRTREYAAGYQTYEEYLAWLTRIFGKVFEKTKPGGFACVIIGTVLHNKRHYGVPFDLVSRFTHELGWEFHQDIIWHKVTGGVKRAGVMIQKPYPGYYYPNIMTEYILVFRKPGPSIFQHVEAEKKQRSEVSIDRLYTMEIANTVWHVAPVPPGHLDHPCPFPEEIPHRLIQLYSYAGELILDPFAGTGQTCKVARNLGRAFIAYETVEKYAAYARQRIEEPLALRQSQLYAVFEKLPTAGKIIPLPKVRRSRRKK